MERTRESTDRTTDRTADEQPTFQAYLPASPTVSSRPGRVERFASRLFRRRGPLKADRLRTER